MKKERKMQNFKSSNPYQDKQLESFQTKHYIQQNLTQKM